MNTTAHETAARTKEREVAADLAQKRAAVETLRHEAGLSVVRSGAVDPGIDKRLATAERELGIAAAAASVASQAIEEARALDRSEAYDRKVKTLKSSLDRRDSISAELQRLVDAIAVQVSLMDEANRDLMQVVGNRVSVLTPAGRLVSEAAGAAMAPGIAKQRCTDALKGGLNLVELAATERADLLNFVALVEQHGAA